MNTTCATDNSESDMSAARQEGEGDKLERKSRPMGWAASLDFWKMLLTKAHRPLCPWPAPALGLQLLY